MTNEIKINVYKQTNLLLVLNSQHYIVYMDLQLFYFKMSETVKTWEEIIEQDRLF